MKKPVFLLSLLAISTSMAVHGNSFWKADLHENLTNVTKRVGVDGFTVNKEGQPWPGIGPNGEAGGTVTLPYSRIPAMTITDDNKMVVMFDLRWNTASDQNRIDPGAAISEDGGHSWKKLPLGILMIQKFLCVVRWTQHYCTTTLMAVYM